LGSIWYESNVLTARTIPSSEAPLGGEAAYLLVGLTGPA
jgi:hypothetical protein